MGDKLVVTVIDVDAVAVDVAVAVDEAVVELVWELNADAVAVAVSDRSVE